MWLDTMHSLRLHFTVMGDHLHSLTSNSRQIVSNDDLQLVTCRNPEQVDVVEKASRPSSKGIPWPRSHKGHFYLEECFFFSISVSKLAI